MPRPLRVQYKGALYHVMNRGACQRPVFYNDERKGSKQYWNPEKSEHHKRERGQRISFKEKSNILRGQSIAGRNQPHQGSTGSTGSPTKARKKRVRFSGTWFDFHTFFLKKRGQSRFS